jgi:thioredoxin 2
MSDTLHITCPSCGSINRVQPDRLSEGPKCGQCKQALFNGKPLELKGGGLDTVLNHTGIPVLVDCWAPWCAPCRAFAPVFEQAARQLEPKLRLAKLNTEEEPAAATRWGIRSIPTLILFKGGKEAQRVSGALPMPQLMQWLKQAGVA